MTKENIADNFMKEINKALSNSQKLDEEFAEQKKETEKDTVFGEGVYIEKQSVSESINDIKKSFFDRFK